jgi:protoporphyrin/coproporphyrin ferrochelatase
LTEPYDALLVVGFGGPEAREDVIPFLENVLRGKNVPRERMLQVAEHYYHFGGISPINAQARALIAALKTELETHGVTLPVYWGNRNWRPLLADTLAAMQADGVRRALAFVLSGYSSYSSCRQYRENIEDARQAAGPGAPVVEKLRAFYNHPRFVAANTARLTEALTNVPGERSRTVPVLFTAHSIPESMARQCDYVNQLRETCRLTAEAAGIDEARCNLVYQSRSGRPEDPWLGPDILDALRALAAQNETGALVVPIGFLSDHMEVLYDLDYEARQLCDGLGLAMIRAGTVGTHPEFIAMIRELIEERLSGSGRRAAIGRFPAPPDACLVECCPRPVRIAPRGAG